MIQYASHPGAVTGVDGHNIFPTLTLFAGNLDG